ncbi:MAG TPA: hypothetical protein DIT09_02510, partial [Glutamicibacter sp.]|nr:hypothetical protein [Glutamicibacter sp.]
MPEQAHHRLTEEFGGNEWLVDELFEQYLVDKNSVDKKWWDIFESLAAEKTAPAAPAAQPAPAAAASAAAPAAN